MKATRALRVCRLSTVATSSRSRPCSKFHQMNILAAINGLIPCPIKLIFPAAAWDRTPGSVFERATDEHRISSLCSRVSQDNLQPVTLQLSPY